MVLVVVANVEGKHVERAVVGVGFLRFMENVVFRNEMSGNGVDAAGERVFHRGHAVLGLASVDGCEEFVEGGTGLDRDPLLCEVGRGGQGAIGAEFALDGDCEGRVQTAISIGSEGWGS